MPEETSQSTENQQSNVQQNPASGLQINAPSREQNQFFATMTETMSKLGDTLGSLPETVANAVQESIPQHQATQQTQAQAEFAATVEQELSVEQKAEEPKKQTFAEKWFGLPGGSVKR